jgi:hypothetical protein
VSSYFFKSGSQIGVSTSLNTIEFEALPKEPPSSTEEFSPDDSRFILPGKFGYIE